MLCTSVLGSCIQTSHKPFFFFNVFILFELKCYIQHYDELREKIPRSEVEAFFQHIKATLAAINPNAVPEVKQFHCVCVCVCVYVCVCVCVYVYMIGVQL